MRAVLLLPNLMTLSIPHQKEAYDGPRQPAQYRKQSATDRRSEVPGSGTRPLHDLVHERLREDCSRRCALCDKSFSKERKSPSFVRELSTLSLSSPSQNRIFQVGIWCWT